MQDGNTALLASASNGCTHVVRYLLENTAADVNAVDNVSIKLVHVHVLHPCEPHHAVCPH